MNTRQEGECISNASLCVWQPAESLATLLTGVYSVLRPSPERPCVLLLLARPGASGVALRLARATAASVQAALRGCAGGGDRLELLGTRHAAFEDYWRFYEALSNALAEHGVAIVRDVHALHPQVRFTTQNGRN